MTRFMLPGIFKLSLRMLIRCMLESVAFLLVVCCPELMLSLFENKMLPCNVAARCAFFVCLQPEMNCRFRLLVREPGSPVICEQELSPMINLHDYEAF